MPNKINTHSNKKPVSAYDDGNIPDIDLPQSKNISLPVERKR